jgi:hypothetical protein
MKKIMLWVHLASMVVTCSGYGLARLLLPGRVHPDATQAAVEMTLGWTLPVLAAVALVSGFGSMAVRSGKSESVLLAISTIAAFVLFFLSLGFAASIRS